MSSATATPTPTPAEVCTHALAVEQEAMSRCTEFADCLEARGDEDTARLFRRLARQESRHSSALARRLSLAGPAAVPVWAHNWLDDGPADTASHDFIYHLMTPYDALTIALSAQRRARDFFAGVLAATGDPEARDMASEMIREEDAHIEALAGALAKAPRPLVRDQDFEQLLRR